MATVGRLNVIVGANVKPLQQGLQKGRNELRKTATSTNKLRGASISASQGISDFVTVLSMPGMGLAAAVRAASNNLEVLATTVLPGVGGALVGVGVSLGSAALGFLTMRDNANKAREAMEKLSEFQRKEREARERVEGLRGILGLRPEVPAFAQAGRRQDELQAKRDRLDQRLSLKRLQRDDAEQKRADAERKFQKTGATGAGREAVQQQKRVKELNEDIAELLGDFGTLSEEIDKTDKVLGNFVRKGVAKLISEDFPDALKSARGAVTDFISGVVTGIGTENRRLREQQGQREEAEESLSGLKRQRRGLQEKVEGLEGLPASEQTDEELKKNSVAVQDLREQIVSLDRKIAKLTSTLRTLTRGTGAGVTQANF